MSEKAVGGPLADDLFNLGGNYKPQNDNSDSTKSAAYAQGANGDVIATDTYGAMANKVCVYVYNATTPMWSTTNTTNAAFRTLPRPGQVKNGIKVTQVQIGYDKVKRPMVTVTGHTHGQNTHDTDGAVYNPPINVPGGFGCPNLFVNTDTDGSSAPQTSSITLSCKHIEADDRQGNHIAGADYDGMCKVDMEFVGTPTLTVPTGFTRLSQNFQEANTEFDKNSFSFEKPLTRN